MSQKEFRNYQGNRFAVFCRTTIWNARIDNRRSRMNWEKKFTSLDPLSQSSGYRCDEGMEGCPNAVYVRTGVSYGRILLHP